MRQRWSTHRDRALRRSRLGTRPNRGTVDNLARSSARTSGWRISACLTAARISRRSVVAGAGSTVISASLTALARVSPLARSLTCIRTTSEPSALSRPTR
jgi:hypothetical protein